ncbi:MAG: hypothetical protein ACREJG_06060 [Candidatus Rokuibacteriota bacterium]
MTAGGIRSRLVAVWVVLLVLVGVIVMLERADRVGTPGDAGGAGHDPRLLLPVPVEQLGAIEVVRAGASHRFERDATGAWFYHGVHTGSEGRHSHGSSPALAERIEAALATFGRTRIERQFALVTQEERYGLTTPEMLVLVYPSKDHDGPPLAQYAVGEIAPDGLSRYVLVVGGATVSTIPNYQIENLLALTTAVAGTSGHNHPPRSHSRKPR